MHGLSHPKRYWSARNGTRITVPGIFRTWTCFPWLWRWWVTIRLACLRWWLGCAGEGWPGSAWQAWKVVGVMADCLKGYLSPILPESIQTIMKIAWGKDEAVCSIRRLLRSTWYMIVDCCKLYARRWIKCGKNFDIWESFYTSQKYQYGEIWKVCCWCCCFLYWLMSHRKWKIRWGRSGLNSPWESSEIPTYLARYWVPKSLSPCRYRAFFETFILWMFSRRLE